MAGNTEELGIRLSAEGVPETTDGLNLAGKAADNLGKQLDGANPAMDRHSQGLQRSGKTAKETAAAWRLLPAQMTDIVTSLASGQPVWLVAIQQGGQIKDSFGGVVPMFRQLAGALTPMNAALGVAAVVAGTVVVAFAQGQREAQEYGKALIMTGNAAGATRDQLADLARATPAALGTQGKAADAIAALVSTGSVGRQNLNDFKNTVIAMEKELGTPLDDVARRFQELARAPLEASLKLNEGVNYLTAAVYEQIRALMAEGKVLEAGELAQRAYNDAMAGRTSQINANLGSLQRVANATTGVFKRMWDGILDVGRPETLEQKITRLRADLEKAGKPTNNPFTTNNYYTGRKAQNQSELEEALKEQAQQQFTSLAQQQATQQRQDELRRLERSNMEANIALELAQGQAASTQRAALAAQDLAREQAALSARQSLLEAGQATLEDQRARDVVSLGDYYQRRAALEQQGLTLQAQGVSAEIAALQRQTAARVAAIDAQTAAERRRAPGNQAEQVQQQARLVELASQRNETLLDGEARLMELRARRAALDAQSTAAEIAAERALMNASADAAERWLDDVERRRQALAQLNDQQRQANAAAAVELIADPYVRAAARARLEISELRRFYDEQLAGLRARLPGLETADPDQADAVREQILQAEQQKNEAIVLRQRQLTEELKPEWRKQLDAWQDHVRLMRESFDSFQSGWLDSGRQAWSDYMRTGKLSLSGIAEFARVQMGDMFFKQVLAQPFSQAGQGIAQFLGLGGQATSTVAETAESTARSLNTAAVTASSTALSSLALTANYAASALAQVAASGGGGGTAGLIGQLLGSFASGGSGFSAVDPGGIGITPGDGSMALPTRGGLASGGSARRGSLYEVNEQGPELLTVNNRTYLMMGGKDGFVTPNGSGGASSPGSMSVTFAPQINIDSRTDRAQVLQLVQQGMEAAQSQFADRMSRGMA